jgi:pimeloyl-ACP methyl ester carboxylesterase
VDYWIGCSSGIEYEETRMKPIFIRVVVWLTVLPINLVQASPDEIILRDYLVIRSVGRSGRSAIHTDVMEAQIVAGKWSAPKAGDAVTLPDGTSQKWEATTAAQDGGLALRIGYAYASVESPSERVMLLEARGHNMVYVNGEPRAGDPYSYGYVRLPVMLKQGKNDLLFQGGRGQLSAKLTAPKSPIMLDTHDATLPDFLIGERSEVWGAVVVINATNEPLTNLQIRASRKDAKSSLTPLPPIPPMTVRKVGFRLNGKSPATAGECEVTLRLERKQGSRTQTLDTATIKLRVRQPNQTYKRTFISRMDGSVQYYAVNPMQPSTLNPQPSTPALFLTLHGAGVEALGQAAAYSSKSWGHIVAPTNRRPFGFDWEDWGRLDAMEVLDIAQKTLRTDPSRTYLTGHSMGGHGAWHVGVTFPDRFAAIGPSAGWISFWSYAGGVRESNPTPIVELLQRATTSSDTLALSRNYAKLGVYVLHGGADDNVPVGQARTMNQHLSGFHRDFVYHEQPGAGHWWESSDEPGAECVDWAPMFDFFAHHAIPSDESVRQVEFTTASPDVSAKCHWLTIEAQIHQHKLSSVSVRCDPGARRFVGTTDNVARLSLNVAPLKNDKPIAIELDGQKIENVTHYASRITLIRENDKWAVTPEVPPSHKGPHRYGPFKDAFRNRVTFVYGTKGTPEETAWAFAKARYDAETFWYRGNASLDVIPDTAFDAAKDAHRNVILYGNAEINAAWNALLSDSPVQVRRGSVRIGEREITGDNLSCLFLRPRPNSDTACVGVVSGTGIVGIRLTDRLPYFLSGVGFPDCIVLGSETLSQGSAGIRVAGYFGLDWSVTAGEFAWR